MSNKSGDGWFHPKAKATASDGSSLSSRHMSGKKRCKMTKRRKARGGRKRTR